MAKITLAEIRYIITSPYYINFDETKVICRICGEERDINDIDDCFLDHWIINHVAKNKEWQDFLKKLENEGWSKKKIIIKPYDNTINR